jgi:hypothetical protein
MASVPVASVHVAPLLAEVKLKAVILSLLSFGEADIIITKKLPAVVPVKTGANVL